MPAEADFLFVNGPVLTQAEPAEAEALAVKDGHVLAVGARVDVEVHRGPATRVVDLAGRPLLPGFVDAHTHLVDHGVALLRLDLSRARTLAEFYQYVRERAKLTPEDGWVVGHGWDESKWGRAPSSPEGAGAPRPEGAVQGGEMPARGGLDNHTGKHPTLLARIDMHMGVANTAALEKVGFDPADFPVGHLREEDFYRAWDAVTPAPATLDRAVREATRRSRELGVTSASVVADLQDLEALERAERAGTLGVRCRLYLRHPDLEVAIKRGMRRGWGDGLVRVNGLKLFADGSIGSKTAALFHGYAGDPDCHGQLMHAPEELQGYAKLAHENGLQLAIHCIGDRAVHEALDAIERAGARGAERPRLEHLELFTDEDANRMAALGVTASAQPNFIGEWGHPGGLYEQRLGADVIPKHNRLRVLAEKGVPLAFGSDHMPYGPLYGIHSAVNAPAAAQRLTVEEALHAYTLGAARAAFCEDEVGSLEPGKRADLVVLSGDPRAAPERVKDLRVNLTVFDGEIVHEAP